MRDYISWICVRQPANLSGTQADEGVGTQEWTSVPVAPGPIGRYGHAVCMHDTRFFVFGGQAEGSFMNDLWAYDIKQRELNYLKGCFQLTEE